MYKEVLQHTDNMVIWPMISFVIFFLFFLILLWWTFTADKSFINHMRNMPFEKKSENKSQLQDIKFNS